MKSTCLLYFLIGVCALGDAYGQNGSYVGLEDMPYFNSHGHEKHRQFNWYHLTHIAFREDSVWVDQAPISLHKRDTIWSASDGGFYY